MQPSMLHNIWKISIEKKRRSEYETNKDIVPRHTRGGGVMNILKEFLTQATLLADAGCMYTEIHVKTLL